MAVHFDASTKTFHLAAGGSSYVMQVQKNNQLSHVYWGRYIHDPADALTLLHMEERPFSTQIDPRDEAFTTEFLRQEYPSYGSGDFRQPAYAVQLHDGSRVTELEYVSHAVETGKPSLEGLPSVYVEREGEADTLIIELQDQQAGLSVWLYYCVWADANVITRWAVLKNNGSENIILERALSFSLDYDHRQLDMLQLSGAWGRERMVCRRRLCQGLQGIESARGASSHQQNPFLALLDPAATEDSGCVYGFSLVYSGNFLAQTEVDHYRQTRVQGGINPRDFCWTLEPGEQFTTPEAVMVFSDQGLNGMSQIFHQLYRTRLARGRFRDRPRPILINNWEATYFDFDEESILSIASQAKDLGIELFVLDDGWFGQRNDDRSSLGDWSVNKQKLPRGLEGLGRAIRDLGMEFGLWFEPEMVSPKSKLYERHPDWCIHVPGRRRTQSRNQLVLDLSRPEVQQYIIESVSAVLQSAPITYVKWDMNRHMTEIYSLGLPKHRQKETAHRYMLGLYRILEQITKDFPDILFESCSGGGGRFDPGMLHYMPQTWTSDNTDAIERLKIQYGTSVVYPLSSMGAHVSAVPNHQTHRITPLRIRGHVNMFGNFGYELDLTALDAEDRRQIQQQVAEYKEVRNLIQQGQFYRLKSPFDDGETAWMVVSEDQGEAYVGYYQVLTEPNPSHTKLQLAGLDPSRRYALKGSDLVLGGDHLMYAGLNVYQLLRERRLGRGDFKSLTCHFRAVP